MNFQSEKFSIRVQDGLAYNAILSQIYFIFYKKFVSYLPTFEQINQSKDNFIKQECIKELNKQNIPEKILDIYTDNTKYFNEKYSISEQEVATKITVEQKGDFILEKIIDKISFISDEKNKDFPKNNIKDIIFGKKNEYIFGCPVIVQNKYTEISGEKLSDDNLVNLKFLQENDFSIKTAMVLGKSKTNLIDLKESNSNFSNKYYFDKKYFDTTVLNKIDNSGFHFEKFIIFDFDKKGFINDPSISYEPPLIFDPKNKKLNFELFYYSCLNSCFFLSDANGVKDIIINPEYLKEIFPLDIEGDGKSRQLYDINAIGKYFSSFMKNMTRLK